MSPLVREILLKGLMAGTAVRTAKKTSAGFGFYGLAGAIGLLGFVFLSIAAYALLQESFTVPVAAAITGVVIIALAGLVALYGYSSIHKKKIVKKPSYDGNFLDNAESMVKSFMEGLEDPVKENPKAALLMAVLAGFAAGDKLGSDKIH